MKITNYRSLTEEKGDEKIEKCALVERQKNLGTFLMLEIGLAKLVYSVFQLLVS